MFYTIISKLWHTMQKINFTIANVGKYCYLFIVNNNNILYQFLKKFECILGKVIKQKLLNIS